MWRPDWNPSEPIEELINRLEDCYIFAIYMSSVYTPAQLIERALSPACWDWRTIVVAAASEEVCGRVPIKLPY